jgi:hypothetical protein
MAISIISFVWTSGPIMGALLTILFLMIIRTWTRTDKSKVGKIADNVSKKIGETIVASNTELASHVNDIAETKIEVPVTCLDTQFYGELFASSLAAGLIVKSAWS